MDSGWVLCNPSWGKTIARTACVKELDMHSYKYLHTADCEPWRGPMSPVLSLSHFQTKVGVGGL